MENNQNNPQENSNQIYAAANNLAKNEDLTPDYNVASYDEEQLTYAQEQQNREANSDMLWGAVWCIGGLIGTFANIGYVFWGAIIFGGIQFVKGLMNRA